MKKDKSEFWKQMIDHIDSTWKKKKGSELGYPFTGKDLKDLKSFTRTFQEWGIMALWDVYLNRENEFNRKTGYSLFQFLRQLPSLVDDRGWKAHAKVYEKQLGATLPEKLLTLFEWFDLKSKRVA